MKIINDLSQIQDESFSLTIGNFDGVHLGHRSLINSLKDQSRSSGLKIAVMTFIPHPIEILGQSVRNYFISSYEQRRIELKNLGVDYLIEINFSRDFSTLSSDDFLSQYVFSNKQIKVFFMGYDFAFGSQKSGNLDYVINYLSQRSMLDRVFVKDQPPFKVNDLTVSSSLIRNKILFGEITLANRLIGKNFSRKGFVVKGDGRGKKIGFPTANIRFDEKLIIPSVGVYVTTVKYKDFSYNSVTNVGVNPTFVQRASISVETHILDFDDLIYGEEIEVTFLSKIRDEKKFTSIDELVDQINRDILLRRQY